VFAPFVDDGFCRTVVYGLAASNGDPETADVGNGLTLPVGLGVWLTVSVSNALKDRLEPSERS
jgi:hypothetical protein